jgi:hypothetical protein
LKKRLVSIAGAERGTRQQAIEFRANRHGLGRVEYFLAVLRFDRTRAPL